MSNDNPKDLDLVGPGPAQVQFLEELTSDDPDYQAFLNRLNPEKKQRIQRHVRNLKNGLYAVAPLMCNGPTKCLFIQHCPIPTRNAQGLVYGTLDQYPMYQQCIMERTYMRQRTHDYVVHLQVNPQNPVEMSLVNEL